MMLRIELTLELLKSVVVATEKLFRLVGGVGLLLITGGCSPWPPGRDELAESIRNNEAVLLRLEQRFLRVGWTEACHGTAASDLVIRRPGEPTTAESSAEAAAIRKMLEETGMYCVWLLENGAVGYEPFYSPVESGFSYDILLTHNGSDVDVPECKEVDKKPENGLCIWNLTPDWRIEYSWQPYLK